MYVISTELNSTEISIGIIITLRHSYGCASVGVDLTKLFLSYGVERVDVNSILISDIVIMLDNNIF